MSEFPFSDLPPDAQERLLGRLAGQVAMEREHSMVDGDVRRRIKAILDDEFQKQEDAGVPDDVVVDRILAEFSPNDLRGIVADWLHMQIAL